MPTCPYEKIRPSELERDDEYFMSQAFNCAIDGWHADEVPIGAVLVLNGEIIARAYNQTRTQSDPTAHAEMIAISMGAAKLGDWRLNHCALYVTKEPCPMCAGATIMARVGEVHYALEDPKMGCLGGAASLHKLEKSNHKPRITAGTLREPCASILQEFFRIHRQTESSENSIAH